MSKNLIIDCDLNILSFFNPIFLKPNVIIFVFFKYLLLKHFLHTNLQTYPLYFVVLLHTHHNFLCFSISELCLLRKVLMVEYRQFKYAQREKPPSVVFLCLVSHWVAWFEPHLLTITEVCKYKACTLSGLTKRINDFRK